MIILKNNSRTGGRDLYKVFVALESRGVKSTLVWNAGPCGYGMNDILKVDDSSRELLTESEWELLSKGYTPAKGEYGK